MKLLKWITIFLACAPLMLVAAETTPNAKVVALTGTVVLAGPDGQTLNSVVGTELPEGSVVTTSPGGQVTVRFFDGTVSIVQPDSHLVISTHRAVDESDGLKEETVLDLKAGGVITSLDPAKKLVTRFQVRTARGVAAARGTVFAVRITADSTKTDLTTMSGTVTFTTDTGTFSVGYGQFSSGDGVQSVADAVKANPGLAAQILQATAAVASQVGDGSITNSTATPNLTAEVLAALVKVAVDAAPDQAGATLTNLLANAGAALTPAQQSAITQAAITEMKNNGATTQQIAAVQTAATNAGVKTSSTNILPPLDQTQIIVSPSQQ